MANEYKDDVEFRDAEAPNEVIVGAELAAAAHAGAEILAQRAKRAKEDLENRIAPGAKDMDLLYRKEIDEAISNFAGAFKTLQQIKPSIWNIPVHTKAIPCHKAIQLALGLGDQKQVTSWRQRNLKHYNDLTFICGNGVPEGKRKYPVALISSFITKNDPMAQRLRQDRDFVKAYLLYKAMNTEWLTTEEQGYQYISSKGFSDVFFGNIAKAVSGQLNANEVH